MKDDVNPLDLVPTPFLDQAKKRNCIEDAIWTGYVSDSLKMDGLLTCFGQVEPFHFAGATLGSAYELQLPMGGVVAHPPGSGPAVFLQIWCISWISFADFFGCASLKCAMQAQCV